MKKILIVLIILLIGGLLIAAYLQKDKPMSQLTPSPAPKQIVQGSPADIPQATTLAEKLDTPWAIAFLPDNSIIVAERPGRVRLIDSNGNLDSKLLATLQNVKEIGEGGLLGITLHPDFSSNNYIYLYYTYQGFGNQTLNRVVRMTYQNNQLTNEEVIVDQIPGASNHNGGRIKFGPDGYLYITTGDAENPSQAQNTTSLGGKILRVTDRGLPAPGNPFNNLVYSYGHRNPQGIAWTAGGQLWQTEHGRSSPTGYDEINLIEIGKNYGWPDIQGDESRQGMVTPKLNSGPSTTWAPAGAAFVNNSLFFGGLRGQALYEAVIQNNQVTNFKEHFKGVYGRIREVILGPDGMLYITTSNRDGRGSPINSDDRIIKVNPQKLK